MKLSKHFTLTEFIKSNTALRLGIDNSPTSLHLAKLRILAEELEKVRKIYGKPIRISSGYRSKDLNNVIGGSSNSQHTKAEAIDLDVGEIVDNKELFKIIKDNSNFDQLINEHNYSWIHVSFSDNPRGEILEAYKDSNNKTKYKRL